jgi:hypothetical protein
MTQILGQAMPQHLQCVVVVALMADVLTDPATHNAPFVEISVADCSTISRPATLAARASANVSVGAIRYAGGR